ncbi:unnamed protein product, partial [Chrysoparadoxa australica]
MLKSIFIILLSLSSNLFAFSKTGDEELYINSIRPLIEQHCYKCHSNEKSRAGINLEKYDDIARIFKEGHVWVKVHEL